MSTHQFIAHRAHVLSEGATDVLSTFTDKHDSPSTMLVGSEGAGVDCVPEEGEGLAEEGTEGMGVVVLSSSQHHGSVGLAVVVVVVTVRRR